MQKIYLYFNFKILKIKNFINRHPYTIDIDKKNSNQIKSQKLENFL